MKTTPFEINDFLKIKNQKVYFKSSENMREVENDSIQLIVTSPPYGSIKDYGIKNQIGFSEGFENYIKRLSKVWKECYRILEPQCRLVINVGDQYLRTTEHGRYRIFSIHSAIIEECLKIGFDYLGDIIWQKISTTNTTGGCSLMGSIYYPRNGLLTYDYEHILIFKKWQGSKRKIDDEKKELSKICLDEWKSWYNGHWIFPGIQQKEHIAMFPDELPYRIIRMFSFIGDTVLDPFVGSGTTLKIAAQLKRTGIGYEINKSFKSIIENKLTTQLENKRKDFHNLLLYLWENKNALNIEFKFNLSKRKGYTVLYSMNSDQYIAVDLLLSEKINTDEELEQLLEKKIQENTVQNFLNSQSNTAEKIDHFVIILTMESDRLENVLEDYNKKFSNKLIFVRWDSIYNKINFFDELIQA